jgi:hypothetical protein
VKRMPQRLSRSMRTKSRAVAVAVHTRGGIMRYATVSLLTPAARDGRGGGVPPRPPPPSLEAGERLGVAVEALATPDEANGGMGRAPTVRAEGWGDPDIRQASQAHKPPVAPGLRGSKHPAAIAPVGLEKPAWSAAWALLPVVGVLVSSLIPRQVRLSLHPHDQPLPGHTGRTTTPTAAVGLALLAHVALLQ